MALRGDCGSESAPSCDGKPLVDVRTGARYADGRLGGLDSEHCLEGKTAAEAAIVFIST
jgi:hypothetical protein